MAKKRLKKLAKKCLVCGKDIKVIIYQDHSYRGGHYFGKIPIHKKGELDRAMKAGTRKVRIGKMVVNILEKDLKPYKYREYWECPKCYWGKGYP